MSVFEITIQRRVGDAWPVVARYQPGAGALTQWSWGKLHLDLDKLALLQPKDKEYGLRLGKALFRQEIQEGERESVQEDIRRAFSKAMAQASKAEPLRVLLIVEDDALRRVHWGQLCAPLGLKWDYLLPNQTTPFSLYLPSQIPHRFPPIGRRDLSALLLVAGPEELHGDYGLPDFDVAATVASIQEALGEIPCKVLASVEGATGPPSLDALCNCLTSARPTLLHIVCHGAYRQESGETVLYFPTGKGNGPVPASALIEQLSGLDPLPRFTFLSTCESADPQAEVGLGGLGQRLVRELGMPAVVAMTGRISITTAQTLASAFYARLSEHGEVDLALSEALAGLQGRYDVTVPALFSRLGQRALWSDALDRPLTDTEILFGLEQMHRLLEQRAPILIPQFEDHATKIRANLGVDLSSLSPENRRERDTALVAVNQLSSETADLAFYALARGQRPPDYDARCPFRGLYPFRAEDREFFFGREALVERLAERLAEHNLLAILGPSGCGKSSLVLAGLVPVLQERVPALEMVYLTPGSEPLAQLDAALDQIHVGNGHPRLVVVDQFEELFTTCTDARHRGDFVERILALANSAQIVLTMRADFWGECAPYPALKDEMQDHQELVAPMNDAALRRAMERQADQVGLRFEAGLSDAILGEVQGEPGSMPLLQHALLLLWQRRHGRWLRWEEYQAIGGIRQAIAHTAEEVYTGLSEQEQVRVRDIFLRLACLDEERVVGEVRDTRRRVGLVELLPAGSDPAATVTLVQQLANARLVVTCANSANGREEVEVAHEALIHNWPRLRRWLDEDRAKLRLLQGVGRAAIEWAAHGRRDFDLVHRGGRLEDAEACLQDPGNALNEREESYVRACVDLRERERQRERALERRARQRLWGVVVILGLLVLGSLGWVGRQELLRQSARAASPLCPVPGMEIAFECDEVTNQRYTLCIRAGRCSAPARHLSTYYLEKSGDLPVSGVDAIQAATFCRWIGRRLPTRTEWLNAATQGGHTSWPWGDQEPTPERANLLYESEDPLAQPLDELQPCGRRSQGATPTGIQDLIGNVWEWTATASDYAGREGVAWDEDPATAPERLIMEGGGYQTSISGLGTAAHPIDAQASFRMVELGIRCVKGSAP
jgi:energy-coupling factor transporter ATP-binding protein EcfA2